MFAIVLLFVDIAIVALYYYEARKKFASVLYKVENGYLKVMCYEHTTRIARTLGKRFQVPINYSQKEIFKFIVPELGGEVEKFLVAHGAHDVKGVKIEYYEIPYDTCSILVVSGGGQVIKDIAILNGIEVLNGKSKKEYYIGSKDNILRFGVFIATAQNFF